jgi:hypothetical protein
MNVDNEKIRMTVMDKEVDVYNILFDPEDDSMLMFSFDTVEPTTEEIHEAIGKKIGELLVEALERFVEEHGKEE